METFEPFGWKWPMGIDFERSFRIDILDHEKELIVRAELPGVEKDDVEVTISGDRLTIEVAILRRANHKHSSNNLFRFTQAFHG